MLSSNSSITLRRGPASLLVVGAVHLVVFWALLHALQGRGHDYSSCGLCADIEAKVIEKDSPPPDQAHLPDVTPATVHYIPRDSLPEFPVPPTDAGATITLPPPVDEMGFSQPVAAEPPAVVSGAAVDPRHPLTQPDYPASSIRSSEQGKIALSVLVGTDGRVLDARVAQSSGFPHLDEAAVKEARAHWRLWPATRNGVPFEQWLTLGVVFRLENR
jgi:periplasmic protein TonB